MKTYYRIMLGRKSIYAADCFAGNFIGADFLENIDLTGKLPDNWRDFNHQFIPVYLKENPEKSKVTAGLACGALHTITKGLQKGDIVLCPNGTGSYMIGEILDNYAYHPGEILPHRRTVSWFNILIERAEMSEALRNSTGSIGTVSNVTKYAAEIDSFLSGQILPGLIKDDTIEDLSVFVLEKYLEDFLVSNWSSTILGKTYDIYTEDGEKVGQQYPSDTGPIDILAISKDKKEILIVELKKGRASDSVVGQIQRYMGYVKEELAEPGQIVKGVIIALEQDNKIKRALAVTNNIEFFKYEINFKLFKI
jgi:restriction system protein